MVLEEHKLTQDNLADALKMTRGHLNRVINGKSDVKADLALKLSKALGTSPEFWLNLQRQVDVWNAYRKLRPVLDKMEPLPEVNAIHDQPFVDLPN